MGGEGGPTEIPKTVEVVNDGKVRYTGYDLTTIPEGGMVRLKLVVHDADTTSDFVPGSGKVEGQDGAKSWSEAKEDPPSNDAHFFKARSNAFKRDRNKYIVFAHGDWQGGAGGPGKAVWQVAVVQILLSTADKFYPRVNKVQGKLLATASHLFHADLLVPKEAKEPGGTWSWSHPRSELFVPEDKPETKFTAKEALTPADGKDKDKVRVEFKLSDSGDKVPDDLPLNITAPKKFSSPTDGKNAWDKTYGPFNSNDQNKTTELIDTSVVYFMFDQFGEAITQSDRSQGTTDEKHVQIREVLPWTGFQAAATWATQEVRPTLQNFTTFDVDKVTDQLQIKLVPFPIHLLTVNDGGLVRLAPALRPTAANPNPVVMELNTHTWHATVSGNANLDTPFTENVFKVVITNYLPAKPGQRFDKFSLKSNYAVIIIPGVKK